LPPASARACKSPRPDPFRARSEETARVRTATNRERVELHPCRLVVQDVAISDGASASGEARLPRAAVARTRLCPTGLRARGDDLRFRNPNGGDRMEKAALPLSDRIGDILLLAPQIDLTQQGRECVALEVGGNRLAIQCADAFERLGQHLSIGIDVSTG